MDTYIFFVFLKWYNINVRIGDYMNKYDIVDKLNELIEKCVILRRSVLAWDFINPDAMIDSEDFAPLYDEIYHFLNVILDADSKYLKYIKTFSRSNVSEWALGEIQSSLMKIKESISDGFVTIKMLNMDMATLY